METSRLTRDGTAEPVSRDQILRHTRGQGNIIFPVQLTTSRIGNLTRLIHTLLYVMSIHKYILWGVHLDLKYYRISRQPIIANTWQSSQQTLFEPLTVSGARASCFDERYRDELCVCVCVCVFFPSILDINGRTSRGHTGGRSHRIFNPPSFCGACLDFCREKDSAIIPFPRRP